MGTSNFHNRNARAIFAISFQSEDEDGDSIHDEFAYDDLVGNLESALEVRFNRYVKDTGTDNHELRSFPSRVLGKIDEYKQYKDFEVGIHLTAIVRSGYYDGCNLDWQIEYSINGYNESEELQFAGDIEDIVGSPENAKRLAKFAEKWASKKGEEMIEKLEQIYSEFTDKYEVTAHFSNGETIYSKIS